MKCQLCDNDARAICRFCGRAVCDDHLKERRFVTGATIREGTMLTTDVALTVDDAVWCGTCHPQYERTTG